MNPLKSAGRFVTFEGIDGAGKTTQIAALQALAIRAGKTVVLSREPGGTRLGEKLRELLLHEEMASDTELGLMFAVRTQHIHELIGPAIMAGHWLLCDRFTDATFAYQGGGRRLDIEQITGLDEWMQAGVAKKFGQIIQPDRTYLFDLDPQIAATRRAQARAADRFEQQDLEFFERVRAVYLARAAREPQRFCVLDASLAPNVVTKLVEEDFLTHCL